MRIIHAIALVLLAAATLVGLGLLALHWKGIASLSMDSLSVVFVAEIALLLLFGFFLGTLFKRQESTGRLRGNVISKLRKVLEIERRQRIETSRDRYKLREKIVTLEGKLKDLLERSRR